MTARTVAVVLVALVTPAHADDVDQRIVHARELHVEGRHAEALAELRAAYEVDPRPDLLFAMAQMQFNLGRYQDAIDLYEQFLATRPAPREAALAHQAIGASRARLAEIAATAVEPPRPEAPPPPPREAAIDGWTIALAATGGSLLAGGGGLYLYARRTARDVSGDYGDYERRYERARDARAAAAVSAGVGVVVLGAAVVRWWMQRAPARDDLSAGLWAGDGTVGLTLGGAL